MYGIVLNPDSGQSQYRQLVDQLRQRISQGSLEGNSRLASTRDLALSLGLSRAIVLEAIDQLKAEGFLETRHGSGTFVRPALVWAVSDPAPSIMGADTSSPGDTSATNRLSFAPGMPDLSIFPKRKWIQCYSAAVEYASDNDLGYSSPHGRLDLRQAIARHLFLSRGMRVGPESIVITAGSSQAVAILAQAIPHPQIVMEDPQAPFIRRIFQGLGCPVSYVPADEQGLVINSLPSDHCDFIYLTPAHQFPLGGTLGAERRVQLLHYARRQSAWIIEDDFDSEFRYDQRPVSPLQVLAPERVIYVGSFSKNLSPALRLGFMVVPGGLLAKVKTLRHRWDLWNEGLQQKALALFLSEGHMDRHIRRAFTVYQAKNRALRSSLARHLPDWEILGASTGMHLVIRPAPGTAEPNHVASVAKALNGQGYRVELVSLYCQTKPVFRDGLIVAFGNRTNPELDGIVRAIAGLRD